MASRRQSRAVAQAAPTALQFSDETPDYVDMEKTRGNEAVGVDDLTIPRIDVIQDLSPQRKNNKPEYIEGAETGILWNTATNRLYGTSVVIVPVLFRKEFVIWKDRDAGGGFRGAFGDEESANRALGALEDGDQCEVVDTAQHFCIVIDDEGNMEEAVLSMSKSKMKPSRQLNTLIRTAGGDRWARAYRMETYEAEGAKGEYQNYQFKQLGFVPKHVFEAAEALYESVKSGARDVDRRDVRGESDDEEERY